MKPARFTITTGWWAGAFGVAMALWALLILAFVYLSPQAVAQAGPYRIVASCPATGFNYNPGAFYVPSMDINGNVCSSSSGGGGTIPSGKTTTQIKVTVAVTNTFQAALASSTTRSGCLLQNNGTHNMFVFFGSATPSDTTTSFVLTPGQAISCTAGVIVATDQVLLTGTVNDIATVSSQ